MLWKVVYVSSFRSPHSYRLVTNNSLCTCQWLQRLKYQWVSQYSQRIQRPVNTANTQKRYSGNTFFPSAIVMFWRNGTTEHSMPILTNLTNRKRTKFADQRPQLLHGISVVRPVVQYCIDLMHTKYSEFVYHAQNTFFKMKVLSSYPLHSCDCKRSEHIWNYLSKWEIGQIPAA